MCQTVGGDFTARLHLVAVEFVLLNGPDMEDAVVLAEDLLASGFIGPATVEVASLERSALQSEAQLPVRDMLAENGIRIPASSNEEDRYGVLLTAFGYWNLPLHQFEGHFYMRIPASDDQESLDRALVTLLDRRDHETSPDARITIEETMRAAVRTHLPMI